YPSSKASLRSRLRYAIRIIEQEDRHFFIRRESHIDCTVLALGGRIPVDLAGRLGDSMNGGAVRVLDRERITPDNDGDAVKRITVPRRRFAGLQDKALDQRRSAAAYRFVDHARALCRRIQVALIVT